MIEVKYVKIDSTKKWAEKSTHYNT